MNVMLNRHKASIFFLMLAAGLVFLSFNFNIKRQHAIIHADAEGYYMYLPAVFIYNGFEALPVETTSQFPRMEDSGKVFTRYTYGVALLELPFFLGAHVLAVLSGANADGYAPIYASGIMMSGVFYAWLGLLFLFREIKSRYDVWTGIFTVVCLLFGTNLYYYTIGAPGMSHVYSFFLFAMTLFLTGKYYVKPTVRLALCIGFIAGLSVLIRPTNILIGLLILGYDVYDADTLRKRILLLKNNIFHIFLMALCAAVLLMPQMAYWQYIADQWFMYSYGNQTFSNWNQPKIIEVLFDVQNGWLVYSPMAFIALIGLVFASMKKTMTAPAIWLILILSIYAFASWWSWCFCAAFGGRSFVELYALLALPLAFFLNKITSWNALVKAGIIFLLCVLIFYNLKLSYAYNGLWEGPDWTWQSLKAVLLPIFEF